MDDLLKIGGVAAILLAVGASLMVMVPAFIRNYRQATRDSGPEEKEVEALRAEVDDLRSLAPRMAELEERLDFAERLLSNRNASEQLRDGEA
jgi:hypothetical protein